MTRGRVKNVDISKLLFYFIAIFTLVGFIFGFGLYAGAHRTKVYEAVRDFTAAVANAILLTIEEAPNLTKTYPKHFLQPARYNGTGVILND